MKIKQGVSFICVIVISVVSFLLPEMVLRFQDEKVKADILVYESDVLFRYGLETDEIMRMIAEGNYETTSLEQGMEMTEEEAYKSAVSAGQFLRESGILSTMDNELTHREIPLMIMDKKSSNAAIIWKCSIQTKYDESMEFVIDDQSGMMVSYIYETGIYYGVDGTAQETDADPEQQFINNEAVAETLAFYYDWNFQNFEIDIEEGVYEFSYTTAENEKISCEYVGFAGHGYTSFNYMKE